MFCFDTDDLQHTPILATAAFIAGLVALILGIPTILTGKKRVKRINPFKGAALSDVNNDLRPCLHKKWHIKITNPVLPEESDSEIRNFSVILFYGTNNRSH